MSHGSTDSGHGDVAINRLFRLSAVRIARHSNTTSSLIMDWSVCRWYADTFVARRRKYKIYLADTKWLVIFYPSTSASVGCLSPCIKWSIRTQIFNNCTFITHVAKKKKEIGVGLKFLGEILIKREKGGRCRQDDESFSAPFAFPSQNLAPPLSPPSYPFIFIWSQCELGASSASLPRLVAVSCLSPYTFHTHFALFAATRRDARRASPRRIGAASDFTLFAQERKANC